MSAQRPLRVINLTTTGASDPVKWSGQSATFFFTGNFAGNVITVQISPDKDSEDDWHDPLYNDFTGKDNRTLTLGTADWIRFNVQGGATPNVVCKIMGESTANRN